MSARPPLIDEPSRVRVGSVDVAYRRAGSGSALVYFHGMGLTRRHLPLFDALGREHLVLVPENPGFGDTPRPRWFRTLDDIVVHQADVLETLQAPRVHVVGHSLGGRIAGSFAALYPERVLSLTLIAPAPLATVTPPELREPKLPDPLPADFNFDDALAFNGHAAAYPEFLDGDDDGDLLAPEDGDKHADPTAWSLEGSESLYRRLARVTCPSQVLVPDEDRVIDHRTFEEWASRLPGAELVHVKGHEHPTGHLMIVQEPDQIADAVSALLRRFGLR